MKQFYICLTLEPYKKNPEFFRGLIQQLNRNGILVTDAEEAPIVDSKTGETKWESLLIFAEEIIPGAFEGLREHFNKKNKKEYTLTHNGLPMLM